MTYHSFRVLVMTLNEVMTFFEVKKQRNLGLMFGISEKAIGKWRLRNKIPLCHQITFAKASQYFLYISLDKDAD